MKNIFRFNGEHYVRITPVQQLKNRIDDLEKDNKRLEHENTVFNENNANLAFRVEEIESDINILNNTNEDLRAEIDEWRNQECRR